MKSYILALFLSANSAVVLNERPSTYTTEALSLAASNSQITAEDLMGEAKYQLMKA